MIRRLNHAVLFVSDLDASLAFYRDVLGFELVSREEAFNAAFLRAARSDNHHDLGLFGIGEAAPVSPGRRPGLYHLAWQVGTIDDLVVMRGGLVANGAFTGESSHGATKSLYGRDPDGNEFEIVWVLPRADWGLYESRAVVEPLDLAAEVGRWTGVATA
jgi:catechol 2,3-dioxygenase-like lactoylglutathione lyase family enzyme